MSLNLTVIVGLSDSEQGLQALIDVVYAYSKKWRFEANVAKCAVVVFRNEKELDGAWTWGDSVLPHINDYTYLGVKFTCQSLKIIFKTLYLLQRAFPLK